MGRQFRFYLLTSDTDRLTETLREDVGIRLIASSSSSETPVEETRPSASRVNCYRPGCFNCDGLYLAAKAGADVRTKWHEKPDRWLIDDEASEVIEFWGCDFTKDLVAVGRFYYSIDMLSPGNDAIVPKRAEFVIWAEAVFRRAKRSLRWSKELDAYVGTDAERWREQGGKFVDQFAFIRATTGIVGNKRIV